MRKSLTFSFLILLMASLMLAPGAAGQGVNVLEVNDGYDKIDNAGETVSFTWVVFNNDTAPYLVQVDAQKGADADGVVTSDVTLEIDQDFTSLDPGQSREIVLTVTADRTARSSDFPIYLNMTFTQMDLPIVVQTESKVVTVHVKAMYESSGNLIFGIWENNLPAPFNTLLWSLLISVLIWIGIAAVIYFLVDPLIGQFTKKTKTGLDDRIMEVTRMPIFAIIVSYGIVDSLTIIDLPQEWQYLIMQTYQVILVLILSYTAYLIFNRIVIFYAEKWSSKTETELDDVLVPLLHKVGIILIPVIGVMTLLSILGIDVTLLVAGLGVVGLVVAFAVQETLGNLFAGIQLLADRPFKVGDMVELDSGEICEVRRIGLRSTTMYNTADHEIIVVPNNDVVNKKVVNYSQPDHHRALSCEVGVAYGTDLKKAQQILLEIAEGHPEVIKQEGQMPYVRVAKLNDSSVDMNLWYWVDIKKMWRIASEIRQSVYESFAQEGIEIPFPQSVVMLKDRPSEL
jgi:small-conductance mechanosensitive channel